MNVTDSFQSSACVLRKSSAFAGRSTSLLGWVYLMRFSELARFRIVMVISILLCIACSNKGNSNYTKNGNPDFSETQIDSTLWLKPSKGIRGIFEDSRGNLWFTSTEYVCMFDGSEMTYFNEKDGLYGTGKIQEDKNGIIWIQAGKTVYRYDPAQKLSKHEKRFSPFTLPPSQLNSIWNFKTTDVWFTKQVERFGKTEGPAGAFKNHNGEIIFYSFPVTQNEVANDHYSVMNGPITDKNGTIWFATVKAAIGINGTSDKIIGAEALGVQNDFNKLMIRTVFEDRHHKIWIGSNGTGVFVYYKDSIYNFTKLHHLDKEGNTLNRVFSIAEDNQGNMWFGTVYSGIWRFDGKSMVFYTEKDGVKSGLIWTIYKTKNGTLLFGAEDPGAVYKFNGSSFDRVF